MSAQVQIKLLPDNYDTIVRVLQVRYSELVERVQDEMVSPTGAEKSILQEYRQEAGEIANALNDLNAKVPSLDR